MQDVLRHSSTACFLESCRHLQRPKIAWMQQSPWTMKLLSSCLMAMKGCPGKASCILDKMVSIRTAGCLEMPSRHPSALLRVPYLEKTSFRTPRVNVLTYRQATLQPMCCSYMGLDTLAGAAWVRSHLQVLASLWLCWPAPSEAPAGPHHQYASV